MKMHSSRVLPSIRSVLEADGNEVLPRSPPVITVLDERNLPATHLMKTVHLHDAAPIAKRDEEQFSFIVHFPENDIEDAQTIFKEKRPLTSHGFPRRLTQSSLTSSTTRAKDKLLLLMTAMPKLLPAKFARAVSHKNVKISPSSTPSLQPLSLDQRHHWNPSYVS